MSQVELQGRLDDACQHLEIDGGAVALMSLGQRAFASHDKNTDGFRVTTPIEIGCLAKPITATLLMGLSQAGLLSLQSPVSQFLSRRSASTTERLSKVCIHHLLCHTHGLGEALFSTAPVLGDGKLDLEAVCQSACAQPGIAAPGEIFSYSTTGYWIAAAVAERVCNSPFREVLHARLLRHLGVEPELCAGGSPRSICPAQGTGLLLSTVQIANFLDLQLRPKEVGVPDLTDERAFSQMHTARAPFPGWGAGTEAMGMGWKTFYEGWTGHNGFSGKFGVGIRLNRERRVGLVVVVRSERNKNVTSLAARLFGEMLPEFRKVKEWPDSGPSNAAGIVGKYGSGGRQLVIGKSGAKLVLVVRAGGRNRGRGSDSRCALIKVREGLYRAQAEVGFLQFVVPSDRTEAAYIWDGQRVWPRLSKAVGSAARAIGRRRVWRISRR